MAKASSTKPVPTPAPITTDLVLFRKDDGRKPERITKAKRDAVAEVLRRARVQRPELVAFVLDGHFHRMKAIPQSVIDAPTVRDNAEGWPIPDSCWGRAPKDGKDRDMASTAESIRLWMKAVFVDTGVLRPGEFAVVVVGE